MKNVFAKIVRASSQVKQEPTVVEAMTPEKKLARKERIHPFCKSSVIEEEKSHQQNIACNFDIQKAFLKYKTTQYRNLNVKHLSSSSAKSRKSDAFKKEEEKKREDKQKIKDVCAGQRRNQPIIKKQEPLCKGVTCVICPEDKCAKKVCKKEWSNEERTPCAEDGSPKKVAKLDKACCNAKVTDLCGDKVESCVAQEVCSAVEKDITDTCGTNENTCEVNDPCCKEACDINTKKDECDKNSDVLKPEFQRDDLNDEVKLYFGDCYKNHDYHLYKTYTFFDMESVKRPYRLKQPSPKKDSDKRS